MHLVGVSWVWLRAGERKHRARTFGQLSCRGCCSGVGGRSRQAAWTGETCSPPPKAPAFRLPRRPGSCPTYLSLPTAGLLLLPAPAASSERQIGQYSGEPSSSNAIEHDTPESTVGASLNSVSNLLGTCPRIRTPCDLRPFFFDQKIKLSIIRLGRLHLHSFDRKHLAHQISDQQLTPQRDLLDNYSMICCSWPKPSYDREAKRVKEDPRVDTNVAYRKPGCCRWHLVLPMATRPKLSTVSHPPA